MTRAHFRCGPLAVLVALAVAAPRPALATWSIVVLDRTRRTIGVAGASCTPDVYGVMSLRPGQGVVIAQAIGYDVAIQRANQLLAAGVAADSVIRAATASTFDSAAAVRRYAVASFEGGLAQFTGDPTARYRGERRAGGDVRCGAQRATSAFLVVARPGEKPFLPHLTLAVFGAERGTATAAGVNAVDLLAARLARWVASGGPRNVITNDGVQPPGRARVAPQPGVR